MLVLAARFPARVAFDPCWDGNEIPCPRTSAGVARWRDLLTGTVANCRGADTLPVDTLLRVLPVAVLVPDDR